MRAQTDIVSAPKPWQFKKGSHPWNYVENRNCSIPSCKRKFHGRGLCATHLYRLREWGTTDDPPEKKVSEHKLQRCPAGCKLIPLTKGKVAIVDEADYEFLMQWTWNAQPPYRGRAWYAVRTVEKPRKTQIRMHRVIMNAPDGAEVDHINHDGLDNRRSNLRLCTHHQNMQNLPARKVSQFKGVSWCEGRGKWRVRFSAYGKIVSVGLFSTEKEAAIAYNTAAKQLIGEFAYLNNI